MSNLFYVKNIFINLFIYEINYIILICNNSFFDFCHYRCFPFSRVLYKWIHSIHYLYYFNHHNYLRFILAVTCIKLSFLFHNQLIFLYMDIPVHSFTSDKNILVVSSFGLLQINLLKTTCTSLWIIIYFYFR